MEAARTEGSLVTSLIELRAIEDQRLEDERAAIESAAAARRAEREAKQRADHEAEAARLAERAAQLVAERAREDAEREARLRAERETRLRIEAAEAAERARQLVALEHERALAELAVRREVALRQRPRWMIAVTAIACCVAGACAWLAHAGREAAAQAIAARDHAIEDRDRADREASGAIAERDDLARQLSALGAEVQAAIARGKATQSDLDRRATQDHLLRLQRRKAELAELAKKRDEERKRRERLRPVVIPAGCLSAAICK